MQGLENYILESARTEGFRASVFTGPILSDAGLPLGKEDVLIPMEFWKIVVMPKVGGGLHATGFHSFGSCLTQTREVASLVTADAAAA